MDNNTQSVDLIHPSGDIYSVPKESVPEAMKAGYKVPTQGQLEEASNEAQYGNRPFSAAAAGAARTLPGAVPALVGTGAINPETFEQLQHRNPVSTTVGEIGGIGAQLALLPGGGAPGVASDIGRGVGEAASGVLGQIGAKAAGSAVEGALYGANEVVNEHALGDPNLTAERAMAQIGTSALWGAGLGGAFGVAEEILPPAMRAAKKAISSTSETLGLKPALESAKEGLSSAYATSASLVSGVPKEDILEAIKNRKLLGEPLEVGGVTSDLNSQYNTVEKARTSAMTDLDAANLNPEILESYESNRAEFQKRFMYKDGNGNLKIDPTKVQNLLKNADKPQGAIRAEALANFNNSSSELVNHLEESYKSALPEESFDKDAATSLIQKNQDMIEGQQQQAMLNRMSAKAQHVGSGAEPYGVGLVAHAIGLPTAVVAPVVAGVEALRYPIKTIARLTKLEELANSTTKKVLRGADALATPVTKTASYLKGYTAAKMSQPQYDKVTSNIQDMSSNMQGLMDTVDKGTQPLTPHAPETSAAMHQLAGRALSFLSSKIPQNAQPGPLASKPVASKAAISSFNRYYQAVEKPLSILKEAAAGSLTHEGIEAVATVYPNLLKHMQSQIAQSIADNKGVEVPYKHRMMLSTLLGSDVDGSMKPQSIIQNQAMLAVSNAQTQAHDAAMRTPQRRGVNGARAKGLDNLSVSERALTPMQATNQRSR